MNKYINYTNSKIFLTYAKMVYIRKYVIKDMQAKHFTIRFLVRSLILLSVVHVVTALIFIFVLPIMLVYLIILSNHLK